MLHHNIPCTAGLHLSSPSPFGSMYIYPPSNRQWPLRLLLEGLAWLSESTFLPPKEA